jgi:uncharacterized protein
MTMKCAGFDWDEGNIQKCQKHGVSIAEIEAVFKNADIRVSPDLKHSLTEQRFKAIGQTPVGRLVFLIFTFRNYEASVLLRVISARFMHKKEIDEYEKDISQL